MEWHLVTYPGRPMKVRMPGAYVVVRGCGMEILAMHAMIQATQPRLCCTKMLMVHASSAQQNADHMGKESRKKRLASVTVSRYGMEKAAMLVLMKDILFSIKGMVPALSANLLVSMATQKS
jgi:hypothetical protein